MHATRDLVNAAPNDLLPGRVRRRREGRREVGRQGAQGHRARRRRRSPPAATAGLVGVGQGSCAAPRLVKVAYAPSRREGHLALVGKGITFDSGGISIKPAAGMEAMKSDMAGAAAVLHTVLAAARLELPVAVTGWLPLAENMPSRHRAAPVATC